MHLTLVWPKNTALLDDYPSQDTLLATLGLADNRVFSGYSVLPYCFHNPYNRLTLYDMDPRSRPVFIQALYSTLSLTPSHNWQSVSPHSLKTVLKEVNHLYQ